MSLKPGEGEKLFDSSNPQSGITSGVSASIASLDDMKEALARFEKIGEEPNAFDLLKQSRESLLKGAAKGVVDAKKGLFMLLTYLLQLRARISPKLLENPDDWAKGLLNEEKYTQWKQSMDQLVEDKSVLNQYKTMFELMKDEEHRTLYGYENIPQLQEDIDVIAGSSRRNTN